MDLDRLDSLARALATARSRRRLLGALTGIPLLGGALGDLSPDDAEAKERRRRRKGRHKRRKAAGKQQRRDRRKARQKRRRTPKPEPTPDCIPEAASQTCANKCGSVPNNCQLPVDCGVCCTTPTTNLLPTDDLQAAIDAACAGATLTLSAGTWEVPKPVQIAKPLSIVGAGAGETILDGKEEHRVLEIPVDVPVTLEALTITRGKDDFGGGGIHTIGELTLIDAELTANTVNDHSSDGGGGAIYTSNDLTLRNTIVHHNDGKLNGGGIRIDRGTLTLESGSSIEENTATFGGGIFAYSIGFSLTTMVILQQGSRLFTNHATVNGGGLLRTPIKTHCAGEC